LLNFVGYRGPALRYIQVRGFVMVRVCNLSPLSGFKSQGAVKGDPLFVGKFVYRLAHRRPPPTVPKLRQESPPAHGADNWRGCVQPPFEANAAAPHVYQTGVKELYREAIHCGGRGGPGCIRGLVMLAGVTAACFLSAFAPL